LRANKTRSIPSGGSYDHRLEELNVERERPRLLTQARQVHVGAKNSEAGDEEIRRGSRMADIARSTPAAKSSDDEPKSGPAGEGFNFAAMRMTNIEAPRLKKLTHGDASSYYAHVTLCKYVSVLDEK
ncbi:unnamed protein product, partial [Discosporangium mesarthrocarpum]